MAGREGAASLSIGINNAGQVVGYGASKGFLATPDCINQVTVNGFTADTSTGLDPIFFFNTLRLTTLVGTRPGIAFQGTVSIAPGLAPISAIHIRYIQNVTNWTGSAVYQPKPDLLADLNPGTTLPALDRQALPPPPFFDVNFNETNPTGPNRTVTADDAPFTDLPVTQTLPDRQLQTVGVNGAATMFLGCTVGGDQTFQTLATWRTLSTINWTVQYSGTLNPGPPPTFTPGVGAGMTAQPSTPGGEIPKQVPPLAPEVTTYVNGPPF